LFLGAVGVAFVVARRAWQRARAAHRTGEGGGELRHAFGLLTFCVGYLALAFLGFTQDYYLGVYMGLAEWGMVFASVVVGAEVVRRHHGLAGARDQPARSA
jgi:hypothetical protein